MKKTAKIVLITVSAVVIAIGTAIFSFGKIYETTSENTTSYYSRIDNDSVSEITPHGGMNYQYSLYVYDESGQGKTMTLDTSRILKDDAFIRIETAPLRGVVSWAEMLYEELPAAVQEKYEK